MRAHIRSGETSLIGREREQTLVAELLGSLPEGGRALHLTGVPGIGKTALLRAARTRAVREGTAVLTTAWAPAEARLRHAALHRLLLPRLAQLNDVIGGERVLFEAAFEGGDPVPTPRVLAAAALSLLARPLSPVLVCVDDLDRLDAASRDTILEMTHLCGGEQIGMILAGRAAPDSRLAPDAISVTVHPLPEREARTLVERTGRVSGYAEQELVITVAQGNPLALEEFNSVGADLSDAAGFGMPPATARLAETYAEDLKGLSVPARTVLLAAALSTSTDADDILGASTLVLGAQDAAHTGLAEATVRGQLVQSGRYLHCPDPLARVAVVHLESAARRMAVHTALGRTVKDPTRAAWHASRCTTGTDEELATALERFAAEPRSCTGALTSLAALERAARLSADPARRATRLLAATELASVHGLQEQALRYARSIDSAGLGERGRALQLWLHELPQGTMVTGSDRVAELCRAARAVNEEDPALAQKLLHAAARRCWWHQAEAEERLLVIEAFEELGRGSSEALALAVTALTEPLSVTGELVGSVVGEGVPGSLGDDDARLLGHAAHIAGDLRTADRLLQASETRARTEGRYALLPQLLTLSAAGEVWLGSQWHAALVKAEESRTIAMGTGQDNWVSAAAGVCGVLTALQGDHEKALTWAAEVEGISLRLGLRRHLGLAVLVRGLATSGMGRYAESYGQLRPLFTNDATPYVYVQFYALAFLAEAALPAGELADARAVVDRVDFVTRNGQAPLLQWQLAYARATLAPADEAGEHYLRALAPGADKWPLLYGMTNFGYGAWLRRRRRVAESRAPLRLAESVFRAIGARTRADLAASELRATGGAATNSADALVTPVLSPQELTIARLAARGLSNRAIGEQLHLSPRTVASHLYRIFPKLDVTSRMQLSGKIHAI
jgi:DNA-binding CsgD family transcriptional regulator